MGGASAFRADEAALSPLISSQRREAEAGTDFPRQNGSASPAISHV
jgi:hypothetical protein